MKMSFVRALIFACFYILGTHAESSAKSTDKLLDQFKKFKSEVKQMLYLAGYNQGKTHEKLDKLIEANSKCESKHRLSRLEAVENLVNKQNKDIQRWKRIINNTKDHTSNKGAIYVRWGRQDCPENGTETIYKGFAGGSWHGHPGGSVDYVCLPEEPIYDEYDSVNNNNNQNMHGAEYSITTVNKPGTALDQALNGHDVPCVVCLSTERNNVLMIPARNKCLDGWHSEYAGYLMGGKLTDTAASEYICVDRHPTKLHGGKRAKGGKKVTPVEGYCGYSLKCPPYEHGRELTCAVCTK